MTALTVLPERVVVYMVYTQTTPAMGWMEPDLCLARVCLERARTAQPTEAAGLRDLAERIFARLEAAAG